MKKVKIFPYIIGAIAALLFIGLSLYIFCPAFNVHNLWLWLIIDIALLIFVVVERFAKGCKDFGWVTIKKKTGSKGRSKKFTKFNFDIKYYLVPIVFTVLVVLFGGDKRDRTADLLNAIQALSQLSYTPRWTSNVRCCQTAFVL